MLETVIFLLVFLVLALFFAFHGVMMLFIPDAANIFTDWWAKPMGFGPHSERERRRETRLAGLLITAMGIMFFVVALHSWLSHPNPRQITPERIEPSWGLLLLGVSMLAVGYYIIKSAERVIRKMLENIPEFTLVRQSTIRVWVWRQRIGGVLIMFGSLIPLSLWIKNLLR